MFKVHGLFLLKPTAEFLHSETGRWRIRKTLKIVPDKAMTTSEAWELDKAVRIKHWTIRTVPSFRRL